MRRTRIKMRRTRSSGRKSKVLQLGSSTERDVEALRLPILTCWQPSTRAVGRSQGEDPHQTMTLPCWRLSTLEACLRRWFQAMPFMASDLWLLLLHLIHCRLKWRDHQTCWSPRWPQRLHPWSTQRYHLLLGRHATASQIHRLGQHSRSRSADSCALRSGAQLARPQLRAGRGCRSLVLAKRLLRSRQCRHGKTCQLPHPQHPPEGWFQNCLCDASEKIKSKTLWPPRPVLRMLLQRARPPPRPPSRATAELQLRLARSLQAP